MSSSESTQPSSRKLSSAEFEAAVDEEILRRIHLLTRCMESRDFMRAELALCSRDPVHFINNWIWTFDPRTERKKYPMKLWAIQVEYIRWLNERLVKKEWGLCEKSRDQGATWLNGADDVHKFCFVKGFTSLFGSINGDKVDDDTLNSIFGKLRYMVGELPAFICPPLRDGHNSVKMKLHNPRTGAEISGETMNDNFGRSGRVSRLHIDEAAHIPRSDTILAAISHTSKCVIWTSSPKGKGNEFARIRFHTKVSLFILDWKDHPLQDQAWYDAWCAILPEHIVASELDRSYEGSKAGRIYKAFKRPYHTPDVQFDHNPAYRQYRVWDFGFGGAMACLFFQVSPEGEIQCWCYLEVKERDIDFCLPVAHGRRPMDYELLQGEEKAHIDWVLSKVPRGYSPFADVGDHSGVQRTANSRRSCRDAIQAAPYNGNFISTAKNTYDWRIKCMRRLLRLTPTGNTYRAKFLISKDCGRVIDCFFNYEQDGSNTLIVKPKINEFSHIVTAAEYLAINVFPIDEDGDAGSGYKARSRR